MDLESALGSEGLHVEEEEAVLVDVACGDLECLCGSGVGLCGVIYAERHVQRGQLEVVGGVRPGRVGGVVPAAHHAHGGLQLGRVPGHRDRGKIS